MTTFNLFVYGTLMKGCRANSFLPKEAEMVKGKIAGNLYHYSAGYPIVKILKHPLSVKGTCIYLKDVEKQEEISMLDSGLEENGLPFDLNYGRVFGEVYRIPYSDSDEDRNLIQQLDSYEGFSPDSSYSLYHRTLIPVQTEEGFIWAWVYHMEVIPESTVHILTGDWHDCAIKGKLRSEIQFSILRKRYIT